MAAAGERRANGREQLSRTPLDVSPCPGLRADLIGASRASACRLHPGAHRIERSCVLTTTAHSAQGVTIKMIKAGDSDGYPQPTQSVVVHYDAYLPNGELWDSSKQRGRPLRFRLGVGQVIPGLDEGIMQLSLGARARMTLPPEMAYGARGFPGLVPPNTSVDFDIVRPRPQPCPHRATPCEREQRTPRPREHCSPMRGDGPLTPACAPMRGPSEQELLEIV